MSVIIFVIILLVLVVAHEWGHFFSAKKFSIRVDEFGFGFPPRALVLFKKGETTYTLNWLPIGGFVKIYGEDPDEINTNGPDAARSFVNKPRWQQAIVLFAGIFANLVLAWLLFSIGFMSGLPTSVGSQPQGYALTDVHLVVVSVAPRSPAEIAGLKTGDKIISIQSGNNIVSDPNTDNLKSFVLAHATNQIAIEYTRGQNAELQTATMTPAPNMAAGQPGIGIAMDEIGTVKLPFFRSLWEGLKLDWSTTKDTIGGLYTLIASSLKGQGSLSSVTGPVGLVGIVGDAYTFGFVYLLSFVALISVNLAVINLIPFPALDGGRLLFLLIEKIKGSRINPKVANTVNMVGFAILIIFMLLVTYHDIVKLL